MGRGLPPLRGFQPEAVEAIAASLASGGRCQLIAACGSGKTLVAAHAAARLCARGVVVIACPSLALVAQGLGVWSGVAGEMLAVCSDDTVADAAVHASDLTCPVTTDVGEIAAWLRSGAGRAGLRLIQATHASVGRVGQGLIAAGMAADMVIIDEAHHTAGRVDKVIALMHHDEHLPATRRLYMTATPRVLGATGKGRSADTDFALSMDDPDTFGPVAYTYPVARAIDDGWLDDYRIAVIGVTSADALSILREADEVSSIEPHAAPLRTAVVQTALTRAAAQFGLRRIMVFTSRIAASQVFARTLHRRVDAMDDQHRPPGTLTVGHVDGQQSGAQRQIHLAHLAHPPDGGWTVLSSARCLLEGVDVPAVDAVCFSRPRSIVDVIQGVGRALRQHPEGTGVATVLVPVLLPDDPRELPDEDGEWATLWQVLRALRAHDSRLAAALDSGRTTLACGGGAALPRNVIMHLPDGYDADHLLRHVTVRLLEQTTPDWLVGYAGAVAYHAEHGDLAVPEGYMFNGISLYSWIANQRAARRRGGLAADRIQALDDLGMEWDPYGAAWQRGLAAARMYHEEHGHLDVPPNHVVNGVNLYSWLKNRRNDRQRGRLPDDRAAALEALGVEWVAQESDWERGLAAARAFHAEHGHLDVPVRYRAGGIELHAWISNRRGERRRGVLAEDRIAALDELGLRWLPQESAWERGLAAARAFRDREGHLSPRKDHVEDGLKLFHWLKNRRTDLRSGKLSEDRAAQLAALGITEAPKEAKNANDAKDAKNAKNAKNAKQDGYLGSRVAGT